MPISFKQLAQIKEDVAILKQHPHAKPLDIFRTLVRMNEHQRRGRLMNRQFLFRQLGTLMGLDLEVQKHERRIAVQEVERAYRATTRGGGIGHSICVKPTRYVIEDPDGRSRIVTY